MWVCVFEMSLCIEWHYWDMLSLPTCLFLSILACTNTVAPLHLATEVRLSTSSSSVILSRISPYTLGVFPSSLSLTSLRSGMCYRRGVLDQSPRSPLTRGHVWSFTRWRWGKTRLLWPHYGRQCHLCDTPDSFWERARFDFGAREWRRTYRTLSRTNSLDCQHLLFWVLEVLRFHGWKNDGFIFYVNVYFCKQMGKK